MQRMMMKEMTKSLPVSKRMVYNSYLKVCDKNGGAVIDKESIEMFNKNMSGNLYKIWNRMTSGSYFPPPVRTVFMSKAWVLDVDIKGFFDNISHNIMLYLLQQHTQEKWV